jgi:hypothetical protein
VIVAKVALTAPDADVIAALLALVGVLAGLWVQTRRIQRENRADHGQVSAASDRIEAALAELTAAGREMRDDVREIKAEVRSHGERLRRLEFHPIEEEKS